MCQGVLLVMMTLPNLLRKAFCDKVLDFGNVSIHGFSLPTNSPRGYVGDTSVYGFFFPKLFTKGCVLLKKHPIIYVL